MGIKFRYVRVKFIIMKQTTTVKLFRQKFYKYQSVCKVSQKIAIVICQILQVKCFKWNKGIYRYILICKYHEIFKADLYCS